MKRLGLSLRLTIATTLACALAVLASQRGRAEAPVDQFQPSTSTVTDTKTDLTWQKNLAMTEVTFAAAQTYCANLTLDGATNWRAPSIQELQTLVDDERPDLSAEQTAFPALGNNVLFWSSTPLAGNPDEAWHVDFRECKAVTRFVSDLYAVRCVR